MPKTYLDYAATTPCDPKVTRAMSVFLKKDFGNPSSIHNFGQKASMAIGGARQSVAEFLGCESEEIVFTGSATEADNLAIFGTVKASKITKPHIITSQIEHPAVLESCRELEKQGAEITYLPVNKDGVVEIAELKKALRPNTLLVSIIYANNEVGTIQPIAEIGELIGHAMSSGHRMSKIYFHTDAVQAANFLDCDVKKLGVDLLTLSAHKIYGPKGIGALYVKKGTPIAPVIYGGGHERGLRSGTENVAGIVGLGQAIKEIQNPKLKIQNIKIRQFRDKLIKTILKIIPGSRLNGSLTQRLANNVNISFDGAEGEAIIVMLDQKGIAASTGSACSSGSLEPSHVLLAMGLSEEQAHGSLRLTLGKLTTQQDIEKVFKVLPTVIQRLRKISGYHS
ncbi:MAG: cysteine desulfurase NifS [Candidatus Nealsonbacteria bacterium RIFCSPHIGHO2_01_FULL_43_31]|uniref:cysteine desulfurase n=2 Tax=Candidatus Nealsoniibacteriota TaxID=1817911 RepID=A0A1G2E687_9BACT|nr:MAG: Cysteine desulfurase [Parcubacteria group bacterium GW2011_GWB1_43_6]OGZ20675.1 MAG: cysteine desulfurase NifS [Candidatus Nealsonbacteria bacterium RIFCSPHIGHO2_01_FULL_43_31]OGZ21357.1 MAG: cysteine desulfurase NifS [Candidatus Nealsonbacteria bacterium RIFCSPHIGHO2_02_FULL_43_13]OGZ25570.1 MAG: cysteine desulfurase NifS [Candidatus Nealsonbacteria bacterium RIFCSPLOWO2_01_FULL_43_36]